MNMSEKYLHEMIDDIEVLQSRSGWFPQAD